MPKNNNFQPHAEICLQECANQGFKNATFTWISSEGSETENYYMWFETIGQTITDVTMS